MGILNDLVKQYDQLGRRYFVGVDLGQSVDVTAIAVVEKITEAQDEHLPLKFKHRYELRHLERLALGTAYPAQVAYVGELLGREPLASRPTRLAIDQTGVGRAVFDMFKRARLNPVGVTITGGDSETCENGSYHVAKVQLISTLQAALHSGDLKIAAELKDAKALVTELQNFRAAFTSAGNAVFAAREGAHDDLVLAVAIALWLAVGRGREVSSQRINFEQLKTRFR